MYRPLLEMAFTATSKHVLTHNALILITLKKSMGDLQIQRCLQLKNSFSQKPVKDRKTENRSIKECILSILL